MQTTMNSEWAAAKAAADQLVAEVGRDRLTFGYIGNVTATRDDRLWGYFRHDRAAVGTRDAMIRAGATGDVAALAAATDRARELMDLFAQARQIAGEA
jgi:hypothetical protein